MLLYVLLFMLFTTANPNEVCPENSIVIDEQCFDFENGRNALPYQEADQLCNNQNKSLPVITDLDTMRLLVRRQLKQRFASYWIGMEMKENSWFYIRDGSVVGFTDYKNETDNYNNKCAAILADHDLQWGNQPCEEKYFYICQYSEGKCDNVELKHGNYCYTLSSEIKNFDSSASSCNELGGKLAEIYVEEEYKFLIEAIKQDKSWMNTTENGFPKYYTDTNSKTIWLKAYFDENKEYWDNSSVSSTLQRCLRSHNLNRIVEECSSKHFAICQSHLRNLTYSSQNNTTVPSSTEQTLLPASDTVNQSLIQENVTDSTEEYLLENTQADNRTENTLNYTELIIQSENTTGTKMVRGIRITADNETTQQNDWLNVSIATTTVLITEKVDWKSFVIIAFVPASIAFIIGVLIICIKMCTTCYSKKKDLDLPQHTEPLVPAKDTRL